LRTPKSAILRPRRALRHPAHGVLDVELMLEMEGDALRSADEKQVVRQPVWIDGTGRRAAGRQEILLAHSLAIAFRAAQLLVQVLEALSSLRLAMPQQRRQGLADLGTFVLVKDDAPAGLRQVLRIDSGHERLLAALRQLAESFDDLVRGHGWIEVLAGAAVDAVEDEPIAVGFHRKSPLKMTHNPSLGSV
jgi:hypothetical protein